MSKNRDVRGQRDQAGVGPDSRQVRHLRPISEMKKIKIASGEPDIRGWNVFTSTGREVGEVHDLLVDPSIGQVVMLDLDIAGTDRRSLAPIRAAWIDRETKRVILDAAQIRDDEILPSVTRGETSDEEVREFDEGYRRAYGSQGLSEDSDWHLRHQNDELRFARERGDPSRDSDDDGVNDSTGYRIERRSADTTEREDQENERQERQRLDRAEEAREAELKEVRYDERALRAERPVVVEEHVVRRRVIDPDASESPDR